MQRARVCWAVIGVAALYACGGAFASVRLQPEEPVTVHVGETAAVHVPSERHYTIGSAGSSLVLMTHKQQQGTTVYFYRAVEIGNQTLVATPGGLGPGQCISCVTLHYFINVIQSRDVLGVSRLTSLQPTAARTRSAGRGIPSFPRAARLPPAALRASGCHDARSSRSTRDRAGN